MNPVVEEMMCFYDAHETPGYLDVVHIGVPRRSGRYPWGSGENPYQHEDGFLYRVKRMRDEGMSDSEIAKSMKLPIAKFRDYVALAKDEIALLDISRAKELKAQGMSNPRIAKELGLSGESQVRNLLDPLYQARREQAMNLADYLKEQVDKKGIVDVGKAVEKELGVSSEKLRQALDILEENDYPVYRGRLDNQTNTTVKITNVALCPPGTEHKDIFKPGAIQPLDPDMTYGNSENDTLKPRFHYPESFDSKRLDICYAEQGGDLRDGLIELRRGVEDISLGDSNYAQVRILVDGTHYLKGMAVYSDDLPDGIDIRFNTNKKEGTPALGLKDSTVLKPISTTDPDNPFGSLIKEDGGQRWYTGKDGKEHLSVINKRAEEGDWGEWSKKLPSQFLSKQSIELAKRQTNLAADERQTELNKILALNNNVIKKQLLSEFADDCDSAAVHLYAAALPRQKYQVILPLKSIGDNEIYAPGYREGETVSLVRFPHGGTFEIPQLKVTHKNQEGIQSIGKDPIDAVGINKKVADQLSGADFDGDTVLILPTNSNIRIKSREALPGLVGFDPKMSYPSVSGMRRMTKQQTQNEMGRISNLITDMTLKKAPDEDLAAAVRHSMVVIDAEKHKLNYRQSEVDNHIDILKEKYQGYVDKNGEWRGGASTLISRAKSKEVVPKTKGSPRINKETGELEWKLANEEYKTGVKHDITLLDGTVVKNVKIHKLGSTKRTYESKDGTIYNQSEVIDISSRGGKMVQRTKNSTQMAETKDAFTLSSGTDMENVYAEYANRLKSMANQARVVYANTPTTPVNTEAKKKYATQVASIKAKVDEASKNKPREREAHRRVALEIDQKLAKLDEEPSKSELKKLRQQALTRAREQVGAKRMRLEFTDKEWEAVQAHAVPETVLKGFLEFADKDKFRERATPKPTQSVTRGQETRIKSLRESGHTLQEIADAVGLSKTTVSEVLK